MQDSSLKFCPGKFCGSLSNCSGLQTGSLEIPEIGLDLELPVDPTHFPSLPLQSDLFGKQNPLDTSVSWI